MAITTEIRILSDANAGIPESYVPATLPALTDPNQEITYHDLAVSGVENADAATTVANIDSGLQTWLDATFYPSTLGLDATLTITSNITVTKIERLRQESNDLVTGVEYYRVHFTCNWEI